MKINLDEFLNDPYIGHQTHRTLPLYLFDYTVKAQIEKHWTDNVMMARGLVATFNGNVIARPMRKFFNLDERPETQIENLPNEVPVITEKLDGSLIIVSAFNGELIVNTRGSFYSEQAEWAKQWLQNHAALNTIRHFLTDTYITLCFEAIYPANRQFLVVNYGSREELVLLAAINTATGTDNPVAYRELLKYFNGAKVYPYTLQTAIELTKELSAMNEGFVVKYSNGLRIKVKSLAYLAAHKVVSGISVKNILEAKMNGTSLKDIKGIPDEWFDYVSNIENKYQKIFDTIEGTVVSDYHAIWNGDRKTFAMATPNNWTKALYFRLYDSRTIDSAIWKYLLENYEQYE